MDLIESLIRAEEEAARRREELFAALERGEVRDPITGTIFTVAFLKTALISTAVSIGASLATSFIVRALTPRQKVRQGQQTGDVFISRSEQGLMIPEVFGGDHDGQGGGCRVGALIVAVSNIQKRVTRTRGEGGKGVGPKAPDIETTEYFFPYLGLMWANHGPYYRKRLYANTDIVIQEERVFGGFLYEAESSENTLTNAAAVSKVGASGGRVVAFGSIAGLLTFNRVFVSTAGSYYLDIYYFHSSTTAVSVSANGGGAQSVSLPNPGSSSVQGKVTATVILQAGANTIRMAVAGLFSAAPQIDAIRIRPLSVTLPTGRFNPDIPPDDPFNPDFPPNPRTPFERPFERFDDVAQRDETGVQAGTTVALGGAQTSFYPGNDEQLPDPAYEADVDGRYGENSATAFRGKAIDFLSQFFLTRWGGVVPSFTGLVEHQTVRTMADVMAHWCGREHLEVTDYDLTGVSAVNLRGLLLGQQYRPGEVADAVGDVLGCYFYEADKIYGAEYGGPVAATIHESELGWYAEEPNYDSPLLELDSEIPSQKSLPRSVEIRFFDPARDYEFNLQREQRQVAGSDGREPVEVTLTMTSEEARAAAARQLYRRQVEATPHSFNLSWKYLFLNPGDSIAVTRDEGFGYRIRLTKIEQGIGILECEGVSEEVATYTQPAQTDAGSGFEAPPAPVPASSVLGLYDGPLLRDTDAGAGIYAWATKRTGSGRWNGAALWVDRGRGYELLPTSFETEAIAGRTADDSTGVLTGSTTVHGIVADPVSLDLYGSAGSLESVTDDDLWNGAQPALVGDEVVQIKTSTREPDTTTYPNRWHTAVGLRARRGTDYAVNDHEQAERFVLLDNAVKFVPLDMSDIGRTLKFKLVTFGQSLDDASEVEYAFEGGSAKYLAPVNSRRRDDAVGNSLLECVARARTGHGLHSGVPPAREDEIQRFEVDIWGESARINLKRTLRFVSNQSLPGAVITKDTSGSAPSNGIFSKVTSLGDGITASGAVQGARGRSLQVMNATGNSAEAVLTVSDDASAYLGLMVEGQDFRTETPYVHVLLSSGGGGQTLEVVSGGVVVYTEDATAYAETGVRVRVALVGSEVKVWKDYAGQGSPSLPLSAAVNARTPCFPYLQVSVGSEGEAKVERLRLTAWEGAQTVYSLNQHIEDFGSHQATLYVDFYQVDRSGRRGYPAEVTLTDSL